MIDYATIKIATCTTYSTNKYVNMINDAFISTNTKLPNTQMCLKLK